MVKKICLICKKQFKVKNCHKDKAKFCSYQCYWKSLIGQTREKNRIKKICLICKKEFFDNPNSNRIYCSKECFWKSRKGKQGYWNGKKFTKTHCQNIAKSKKGNKSHWQGGTTKHEGYIFIRNTNHPFCNGFGYIKRSRLVMEQKLERYLKPNEVVHHINGIKSDDRPENLMLFANNSEHIKYEHSRNK